MIFALPKYDNTVIFSSAGYKVRFDVTKMQELVLVSTYNKKIQCNLIFTIHQNVKFYIQLGFQTYTYIPNITICHRILA